MKHFKLIALLLVGLVSMSCDEEDVQEFFEDPEVDITTSFVVPVEVVVGQQSNIDEPTNFTAGGAYDLISNPQIAEEIGEPDRITKVVINSMTYEFKNFTGNVDANVQGDIRFPLADQLEWLDVPSANAAESDLFGTVYAVNGDFTPINDDITESKVVIFNLFGLTSHNPVDFTFEVVINATVTLELNLDDL